jgi:TonB family protein
MPPHGSKRQCNGRIRRRNVRNFLRTFAYFSLGLMTRWLLVLLLSASSAFGQAAASLQTDVSRLAIYAPQPEYPVEVRQHHIGGSGYFVIRVNRATGIVATVEVRRSTGNKLLDSSAVETLRHWRFKGGNALSTRHEPNFSKILVPVTFRP